LPRDDEVDNPPKEISTSAEIEDGGEFILKIADFGFARHLGGVDLAETMCGSPLYMVSIYILSILGSFAVDKHIIDLKIFAIVSNRLRRCCWGKSTMPRLTCGLWALFSLK
jgi:hypothetical protein